MTSSAILHRIANLDRPGVVHVAAVSRRGGFTTYCTGRHVAYGVGTPAEVTCKSCVAKAAANGVDTAEL